MNQTRKVAPTGHPPLDYEAYFVPAFFSPWAEDLLIRTDPAPGDSLIDVACGTGVVSRLFAQMEGAHGRIVGVDAAPAMLAVAGVAAEREGLEIEWLEGDAADLPVEDAAFSIAVCHQGLQFFPDRLAAAKEMRRVLKPGGRAAVAVWNGVEHFPIFAAWSEAERQRFGKSFDLPFEFGPPEALRDLLQDAGFRDVEVQVRNRSVRFPNRDDYLVFQFSAARATTPEYQAMDDREWADYRTAMTQDLAPILDRFSDGEDLVMGSSAIQAIARA
jgi:SAM-dependent methyltransferase